MRSPTSRTKRFLEKQGWLAEVVEKWVPIPKHPGGGIRKDLFDAIDIIACNDTELIGIQSTSGSNHTKRVEKALASDKIKRFLKTRNQFEVWSWSKKGARGKRKLWMPRVTRFIATDDEVITVSKPIEI